MRHSLLNDTQYILPVLNTEFFNTKLVTGAFGILKYKRNKYSTVYLRNLN